MSFKLCAQVFDDLLSNIPGYLDYETEQFLFDFSSILPNLPSPLFSPPLKKTGSKSLSSSSPMAERTTLSFSMFSGSEPSSYDLAEDVFELSDCPPTPHSVPQDACMEEMGGDPKGFDLMSDGAAWGPSSEVYVSPSDVLPVGEGVFDLLESVRMGVSIPPLPLPPMGNRRKASIHVLPVEEDYLLEEPEREPVDVKPFPVPPLDSSEPKVTRGRKRLSPSTPQHPSTSKRSKKYDLSDDEDPSVKNAKAAKANRDKKKLEVLNLRAQNEEKDAMLAKYKAEAIEREKYMKELERSLVERKEILESTAGFVQIGEELKKWVSVVVPGVQAAFSGTAQKRVKVLFDPGFTHHPFRAQGERVLSTHFNMDSFELIIGNPIYGRGQSGEVGLDLPSLLN